MRLNKSTIYKFLYNYIYKVIPTLYYCYLSHIKYDRTYKISGRIRIIKPLFTKHNKSIIIGRYFIANSNITSNSIGLIQPCIFSLSNKDSKIIIGNNVGISGSTICARTRITIEDNVLIGSGCLISDSDSHPINYLDRLNNKNESIQSAPIHIESGAFIGARSIILKGVTIGKNAIIGAGSVITRNVPPNTVFAGNPAVFIKNIVNK